MKSRRRAARILNNISILCFVISSLIMVLMPLTGNSNRPAVAYIPGIVFWLGLLGGVLFYSLSVWKLKSSDTYRRFEEERRIGALSPGATPEGLIADILFIPSLILSIAGTFFLRLPDILMVAAMWIAILSLYGHFILNGKVYRYLHQRRMRKRPGKQTEKESDTVRQNM